MSDGEHNVSDDSCYETENEMPDTSSNEQVFNQNLFPNVHPMSNQTPPILPGIPTINEINGFLLADYLQLRNMMMMWNLQVFNNWALYWRRVLNSWYSDQ